MQRNLKKYLAAVLAFVLALALCLSACAPQVEDSQNSTGSESTQTSQQTQSSQSGTTGSTGSTGIETTGTTESTGTTVTTGTTESTGTTETTGNTESGVTENTETKETQSATQATQPPHTHSYTEKVTAPTCKDKGYTTYTCSCGHSYKDKEVPATGNHNTITGKCKTCGQAPVPKFTGGTQKGTLYNAGNNDNYLLVYYNVSVAGVKEYEAELTANGYTLVQSNEIGSNRFTTHTKGDQMVHCVYFAADKEYRITYGVKTYMGSTEPITGYDSVVTPSVSLIAMSCDAEAGTGMSMVVQLADGSFVIIDGGFGQKQNEAQRDVDMKTLLNFLKEHAPAGTKPQVTWMITHADWDHIGLPTWFMKLYGNQIQLNTICYNFPITNSMGDEVEGFLNSVTDKFPNVNHYIMHTGNKLYLPGCEIEFLFTASEDLYPTGLTNGNYTSNAWRFTIEGKTIFITGDIETPLCSKMARNYGNYLASDILQVVHHGVNGATKELYQAVTYGNKLKVCFWTIPTTRKWRTEESGYRSYNQILWNSGADHYYHDYTTTLLLPSLTKK